MSNEKNETLKPGDRVRLTGWKYPSKSVSARSDFKSFGHKIPCEATVTITQNWAHFETEDDSLNMWDTVLFTYEKIQDDGNG